MRVAFSALHDLDDQDHDDDDDGDQNGDGGEGDGDETIQVLHVISQINFWLSGHFLPYHGNLDSN